MIIIKHEGNQKRAGERPPRPCAYEFCTEGGIIYNPKVQQKYHTKCANTVHALRMEAHGEKIKKALREKRIAEGLKDQNKN